MSAIPAISICIPAYRNTRYLERLLDSIAIQSFHDYEVVITDDSPDDAVESLVGAYRSKMDIRYFRNHAPLGTPENWNAAIRNARGTWIKLVHDDDWFATPRALADFFRATQEHPGHQFFFSAFQNVTEETGHIDIVTCNAADLLFLKASPLHLFKRVYVGNPSCTLIHRDLGLEYDRRFKFVVDFEFYIRCLRKTEQFQYIGKVLLNIGFHREQVTKYTFGNPGVQIPENHLLPDTLGADILRNVFVYDYYWRMYRNLGIRSREEVQQYHPAPLHPVLEQMIRFQQGIPPKLLRKGPVSKLFMLTSYMRSLSIPVKA